MAPKAHLPSSSIQHYNIEVNGSNIVNNIRCSVHSCAPARHIGLCLEHIPRPHASINRRYQPRRENEVWYQHECQSRPECRPQRGARGSGLAQVLFQTRDRSPRGWYCIYQIFQHLNQPLNQFICNAYHQLVTSRHSFCLVTWGQSSILIG